MESSGSNKDPEDTSVLEWCKQRWRYIISGGWLHPGSSRGSTQAQEVNDLAGEESGYEANGISSVQELVPEGAAQGRQLAEMDLSLEMPVGSGIRLDIDVFEGQDSKPEIRIQRRRLAGSEAVKFQLDSPNSTNITLIEVDDFQEAALSEESGINIFDRVKSAPWTHKFTFGSLLFVLALVVYLLTRFIGLEEFPIYFFTDEAVHTILAESLVQNGFKYQGEFLPTYFPLGSSYGLNSASVYLQVLPYLLFGKSVFVTRATAVLVTFLGAAAVGLIVKDFFKSPYWWMATLLLSITPTWFLHSRTAFENVAVASFYACFLYFYLRYRLVSPRSLYPAIIFAALAFYAHGLGQFLMVATAILLFFLDLRYHWKQRAVVLGGLILIVILLIPYFRFVRESPQIFEDQMRQRASYWTVGSLSLVDKLTRFAGEYLYGFNPLYWFNPQPARDLIRHIMKGYGHIFLPSLPFFVWGLIRVVKRLRSPAYRTIFIALLAAPVGAAMAEITILRTIWIVIPVTILTTLGLSAFLKLIEGRYLTRKMLSAAVLLLLVGFNLFMLRDALVTGPLWYRDYTLYGMQYGAGQLFGDVIPEMLEEDPNTRIVVTPTWANGADNFKQFFLSAEQRERVTLSSIGAYLYERLPIDENLVLVLTSNEYQSAVSDNKLKRVSVDRVVEYPDGSPGFYFVRLAYADNVDEIFAVEREARRQLVETVVELDGHALLIRHSMLDMGTPAAIFDGDTETLMRGLEANPLIIDLFFQEPRFLTGIRADFANMDFTITAQLFETSTGEPIEFTKTMRSVTGDPHLDMEFQGAPGSIERLRLEIYSYSHGERAHIHVRELELIP